MRYALVSSLLVCGFLSACDQDKDTLQTFSMDWTAESSALKVTLPYTKETELNTPIQTALNDRAHSFFGKDLYLPNSPGDKTQFDNQAQSLYNQANSEAEANDKQLASQKITPPSGSLFDYSIKTTVKAGGTPYQVISVTFFKDNLGAAHPSSDTFFLNVDMKNKKVVDKLSDAFSSAQQTQIAEFVFKALGDQLKDGLLITSAQDLLPLMDEQFAFTSAGLQVTFPPYVVAPYVYGTPSVTVPSSVYGSN